jgi:hypothetical protein
LIGTAALGAAGWTGAYLMSLAIGPKKTTATAIIPSTDSSSAPKSTTTSTTTAPSTTTTSTSSTPTYDAAKAVQLTLPSGGKAYPVGTSFQIIDTRTGLPVPGDPVPDGIVGIGPGPGQFVAIAPGMTKIMFADASSGQSSVTVLVTQASGTAGVSGTPKRKLLPPPFFPFRALLGG